MVRTRADAQGWDTVLWTCQPPIDRSKAKGGGAGRFPAA